MSVVLRKIFQPPGTVTRANLNLASFIHNSEFIYASLAQSVEREAFKWYLKVAGSTGFIENGTESLHLVISSKSVEGYYCHLFFLLNNTLSVLGSYIYWKELEIQSTLRFGQIAFTPKGLNHVT